MNRKKFVTVNKVDLIKNNWNEEIVHGFAHK